MEVKFIVQTPDYKPVENVEVRFIFNGAPAGKTVYFDYKIGDELISANTDCNNNGWYADGYGWTPAQSQATQNMLNHVCSF